MISLPIKFHTIFEETLASRSLAKSNAIDITFWNWVFTSNSHFVFLQVRKKKLLYGMYKYGGGVNRRAQVEAEFMFQ